MSVQTVENIEMFSEIELESLQFLPEELEQIQSELEPDLDSISLEEVAKDVEAILKGGTEEAKLEKWKWIRKVFRRKSPKVGPQSSVNLIPRLFRRW